MSSWEEKAEMHKFMKEARLRDLYVGYANQFPDYFLTLTSKTSIPFSEFVRRVREFHRHIDRKLLGREPHKRPVALRTQGIMFLEDIHAHVHGHAMVRFAGAMTTLELRSLCSEVWGKLTPGGRVLLQEQYGEGPAGYATKEMERWGYDDLKQVILFRDLVGS